MAKIFLSHSKKDEHIAEKLKNQIEQMNSKVYMFEHDQQPGKNISDKIEKEIKNSDIVFVLLTVHSKDSTYVQQEIGYAKGAGVRLIALVESAIDSNKLGMLTGVEYINFDPDNPDKSISDAQVQIHKHDMQQLRSEEIALIIITVAALCLLVYYARSGQPTI